MNRHYKLLLLLLLLAASQGQAQTRTLTKAQYYDKTLAMLIGTCGGVVTGYEYLKVHNTPDGFYQPGATLKQPLEPLLGLPDSWFILLNGTLGGTTKDEFNYFSNYEEGKIYSDDDQHVEVFNQHMLEKFGPSITYEDIRKEWIDHDLRDFGGTSDALGIIASKNLIAPHFGQREHGNNGHWLPECYIEHEMMGANFPGMPLKAAEYVAKFSSMSGQGENLTWGQYWAAAHAIAYFETDVRVAIQKALDVVPGNSWIRGMYDTAIALHQRYPNDWRAAVRELWTQKYRNVYAVGYDKVMLLSDVNHGTGFLAILYGQNDYMETLKICSLAGGDGDCTAANICGLMGIIKGMAGTPQAFVDKIYKNGTGIWINDVAHGLHMHKDFPRDNRFTDLTLLFQRNAESMIRAFAGNVAGSSYTITNETPIAKVTSANWDFELGALTNWTTQNITGTANIWAEKQYNNTTLASYAATGLYKGTILTNSDAGEAKLYQTITGLKPNTTYKIEGRIHSSAGRQARLYADNYGGSYVYTSVMNATSAFPYRYLYIKTGASNTSVQVGLHAPPTTNAGKWCNIDDIIITEEPTVPIAVYQAEAAVLGSGVTVANTASASGGAYITGLTAGRTLQFNITSNYTGEKLVRIYYANAGVRVLHPLTVNNRSVGNLEMLDTGPADAFSMNYLEAAVKLNEGANTFVIGGVANGVNIDKIEVLNSYNGEKPADNSALINGGIYKIVARHSGRSLNLNGVSMTNGAEFSQWDYVGGANQKFRIEAIAGGAYAIYAVHSNKAVDVLGSSTANLATVGQWDYVHGGNQQWAIIPTGGGYYKIVNNNSGKCLDVEGSGMGNGALVKQYDYLGGYNQQWTLEKIGDAAKPVAGGIYKIVNRNSGKIIEVSGVSQNQNANVVQWDDLGGAHQRFKFELSPGGYYVIRAMHSNRVLKIAGPTTANGSFTQQGDLVSGTTDQQWSIQPVTGIYFKLINRYSNKPLEVTGSNLNNGASIGQWDSNTALTQQWSFERKDNGQGVPIARVGTQPVAEPPSIPEIPAVKVFPNPSKGNITINVGTDINAVVELYNLDGRLLLKKEYQGKSNIELDVTKVAPAKGIFVVQVKAGGKTSQHKIVVQ
jgi:hypothetical protein